MRLSVSIKALTLAALAGIAAGHCVIIAATGNLGGQGTALGCKYSWRYSSRAGLTHFADDSTVPRNATTREAKMDATRFIKQKTDQCGMTLQTGNSGINVTSATSLVIQQSGGLPKVSESGFLNMTLHQINEDGAGPFDCKLDTTGTGLNFTSTLLLSLTQVPGVGGRNKKKTIDWPFAVGLPSDMKCTGSSGNLTGICMVKCWNPVGPWGGCVPIQQVDPVIELHQLPKSKQDCDSP